METPNEKVVINSRFLFDVVERSLTDAYDEKIIIGTSALMKHKYFHCWSTIPIQC